MIKYGHRTDVKALHQLGGSAEAIVGSHAFGVPLHNIVDFHDRSLTPGPARFYGKISQATVARLPPAL